MKTMSAEPVEADRPLRGRREIKDREPLAAPFDDVARLERALHVEGLRRRALGDAARDAVGLLAERVPRAVRRPHSLRRGEVGVRTPRHLDGGRRHPHRRIGQIRPLAAMLLLDMRMQDELGRRQPRAGDLRRRRQRRTVDEQRPAVPDDQPAVQARIVPGKPPQALLNPFELRAPSHSRRNGQAHASQDKITTVHHSLTSTIFSPSNSKKSMR